MKKLFIPFLTLAVILLTLSVSCSKDAQEANQKAVKELKFKDDKSFKIIQFTDIHYIPGNDSSRQALALLGEAIDAEKPDLVVITGDLIWREPAKQCLDEVLAPIVERNVPWAYILGNHDSERDLSRDSIMMYAMEKPNCYAQMGPDDLNGFGNYIIEIKGSQNDSVKSVLYFFDSGDYATLENQYTSNKKIGGYAWLSFDQIAWYRNNSKEYWLKNDSVSVPSLAFFHIPLREYTEMAKSGNIVGTRNENECPALLNSGMFTAMREAGDIMGTFTGHDHDNDYIGVYQDIALAYGRYSGGKTVYNNLGLNGCRIIELTEGSRSFTSYIRLMGGEKLHEVKYPDSFKVEDAKVVKE